MSDIDIVDAAFERAEAAFERAITQAISAREVDFQKLAEQVLADLAALAVEQILSSFPGGQQPSQSGAGLSAAIARAATKGGRFL